MTNYAKETERETYRSYDIGRNKAALFTGVKTYTSAVAPTEPAMQLPWWSICSWHSITLESCAILVR